MALFDESVTVVPAPRRRMPRAALVGAWSLAVALVVLLVITFLPTSYVIMRPGPLYNTLGTAANAQGEQVPLIQVEGAETYPTDGAMYLTTLELIGNRERTPSWFELAMAWFDPSRAVVPLEQMFPEGTTTEQRNENNAMMMVDSQQEATAAALTALGYDVGTEVVVWEVPEGSASAGILEVDDVIVAVDGVAATDTRTLPDQIQDSEGEPVALDILRDGEPETVTVTPVGVDVDGETVWRVGISIINQYDFPVDVTIQLDRVGGPSAGMMFALGIIDTMTPGQLNGGKSIAGTGTIDAEGTVGPIGGIRQKLYGSRDTGAEYFLAPVANCDEVVGHVPSGLRVFAVGTLDEALATLDVIATDGDLDALATCATAR